MKLQGYLQLGLVEVHMSPGEAENLTLPQSEDEDVGGVDRVLVSTS